MLFQVSRLNQPKLTYLALILMAREIVAQEINGLQLRC